MVYVRVCVRVYVMVCVKVTARMVVLMLHYLPQFVHCSLSHPMPHNLDEQMIQNLPTDDKLLAIAAAITYPLLEHILPTLLTLNPLLPLTPLLLLST